MKRYLGLLSIATALLGGCALPTNTMAVQSKDGVSVSLHGVNYTAEPFRYVVIDPNDPSNRGGGEHVGPFSAGGTVCCYVLPKQWKPGIQVQVRSTHWLPIDANANPPEVTRTSTVEVPPYTEGKAGELWVLRMADGSIDLVSRGGGPNHPSWPGKVKGWPEPSTAYQGERRALHRKHAESSVANYQTLLNELRSKPESHLVLSWEHDLKYRKDEMAKFRRPSDPAYAQYLLGEYSKGLRRAQARLEELMKETR